jgi:hypothetical protein
MQKVALVNVTALEQAHDDAQTHRQGNIYYWVVFGPGLAFRSDHSSNRNVRPDPESNPLLSMQVSVYFL